MNDELSEELYNIYKEIKNENESDAEKFWDTLSYDDKCNAFHAVVSRLVKGEIELEGSYRYVLYDIFGFDPDMYTRGMDCGYMTLHNRIMTKDNIDLINNSKLASDDD